MIQSIEGGHDEDALQDSINGAVYWASSAGLTVNAQKTRIIKFARGKQDTVTSYTCDGNTIEEADAIKYLGITFDRKMTFNLHAAEVRERTTRFMYAGVRLCKYIKQRKLIMRIYKIYVEPIILYAAAAWTTRTKKMAAMLENGHRIATRTALNTPIRPHLQGYMLYADRCSALKTLTVAQRTIQFNVIVAKRFAEAQTFTENARKILDAINEPDINRRMPLPLVSVVHRRQYAMTPLGFLLKNMDAVNMDINEWRGPFNALKTLLENNVLLYV